MRITPRRTTLALLLALAVVPSACGGDDESAGTPPKPAEQSQPATAPADPAVEAEKAEETQALGTMNAFVQAIDTDDEAILCGIVTEDFLGMLAKGLTVAQCVEDLKGVEFNALRRLKGATAESVEVDGDVAAGTLRTTRGTDVGLILRKPAERWLVKGFPGG